MKKAVKTIITKKGVKSSTDYLYIPGLEEGRISDKEQKAAVTLYDENGFETETCIFDENDNVISKVTYKYNEAGKVIELKGCDCQKGTECCRTYAYDENNRLIRETFHATDIDQVRTLYKYDENGLLIEELQYTSTGDLFRKEHYEYSSQGSTTEQTKFIGAIMLNKSIERITAAGRETEGISYNEDGTIEERIVTKYNQAGLPVEEIRYHDEEEPDKVTTYEYDSKGNLCQEKIYGRLDSFSKRYIYDDNGNLTVQIFSDSNGKPEYAYKTVYEAAICSE